MQNIWNILKNGLRDYCEQNGFSDVVLGLSGGLDSAVVSVLAADALGAEHVHCVMMKTKYTSELSLQIAQELADKNGFDYRVIDIEPIIENQEEFLCQILGETPKQVVLENLQARERGKFLMAMSNQFGWLVLACGNKSEASVGYCTLYGDTCGGLMPIGNVYKSHLYDLARWRNTQNSVLPEAVINRAPSAELRAEQKDEDSLPPYEILDKILILYVEGNFSLKDTMRVVFTDKNTINMVADLYYKSAFKRKQLPPAIDF